MTDASPTDRPPSADAPSASDMEIDGHGDRDPSMVLVSAVIVESGSPKHTLRPRVTPPDPPLRMYKKAVKQVLSFLLVVSLTPGTSRETG